MGDVLFAWPAAAAFGRRVPKEKLYEHGSVTAAVRERFIADVAIIEWAYKLAESTIKLPGSAEVPEVQVFRIAAKGDDVPDTVLAAIDRAVAYPLVFEVTRGAEVRMTAAVKKLGAYHSAGWMPATQDRQPLPTAITLAGLYTAIVAPLLPVSSRAAESPLELAARMQAVAKLERDIAATETRLRTEPQFNRKLDLRRALSALRAELETKR